MKPRLCSVKGCQRARYPHFSRCSAHIDLLVEAIFGPRKEAA